MAKTMKTWALVLAAVCLLTACGQASVTPPAETAPEEAADYTGQDAVIGGEIVKNTLSPAEIQKVCEAFKAAEFGVDELKVNEAGGFFCSFYDDVRELDFAAFLRDFPVRDGNVTDQAEFDALMAVRGEEARPWSEYPAPAHRYARSAVDAVLERYAGITAAELHRTGDVPYLEAYDSWYNFTSDFGPGFFVCGGGTVEGDTARLWSPEYGNGGRVLLTLGSDGGQWHIRSLQRIEDEN